MQTIFLLTTILFAVTSLLLYWRLSATKPAPAVSSGSSSKPAAIEDKSEALKKDLEKARADLQLKSKQLEEAREEAKKKLRREGKKQEKEEEKAGSADPRDVEIAGLKKGMAALESQLNTAKRDVERMSSESERVRGDSSRETEGAQKARDDASSKARALADENAMLKRTLDELRSAKRKENERPDVPGTGLDLKALPADAVQELARYFRKGEEFERLFHVTSGQMQLEKDRYQELQRRYFAVCRELALVAGQKPGSDADAKSAAEGLVAGSDQAARAAGANHQSGPQTPGAAAAPGEPGKKRRRRRRKKKPGAQGVLPGTEGMAADAEGAEAAEGEEYEDGDEADEGDEGETTPPQAAPETGSAPAA
jgi:hypothetical protein